ncbi:TonB-dependent receptor [Mucilaginibacter sp. UR6-11]|uniref:TonB-dependent receptor n=1 Tax=Mucilaginibacter sp. UR6-11 TaxID=1435644 RepID=UPI001E3E2621|nr:TonB-dependent receptor [Mucilaginibacter sp. UR6-11]MCC8426431.1 TonB-dependent receptor [Mucilaginibacter sp. UR6-11]
MKLNNKWAIGPALFCLFLILLAFVPKTDDPLDKLVASLQRWSDTNPQEKIYLHTDKPYYLVGDTIWFKAYITTGSKHQLSAISGAVYVELLNEGDSVTKVLKLPVTTGMAVGDFVLDDDVIHEGNYRIRAYTQWMRNAGPDYFYDRTFTIGNSIANTVFAKIDYVYTQQGDKTKVKAILKYTDTKGQPYAARQVSYLFKKGYEVITSGGGKTNELGELSINLPNTKPGQLSSNSYLATKINLTGDETVAKNFPVKIASLQTDFQFFPESGNLVNGVKSKVAFKATATNGLGAAINGVVTDNNNNEVARLELKHLGMGYFYLLPEAGKTYRAKINYPDGSVNTVNLPAASDDGYVMSVFHSANNDSVLVKIDAGAGALKSGQNISLIGQSNGKVYFAANVPVGKSSTLLYFPVHEVPSGILQFTLFSAAGDPLNERITFIQNNDNIDLRITSLKPTYGRREKVELNINAIAGNKPVGGNFSISVISETAVPSDEANENTIFSQLLLSSDIKGYIEKPNYYFYNPDNETRANLDVLMLTQGYRRFAWKNILTGVTAVATYKAEKLVNSISGRLTGYNHKPVAGGKVILINNKLNFVRDTVTDSEGRFKFSNLLITDGIDFTIQGTTSKNGKKVNTEIDEVKPAAITANNNIGDINADIPQLVKASVDNEIKQDQELTRQGLQSRVQQLKEVRIRAAKARYGSGNISESQADEVYRPDSREPCATLKECIEEMYHSRVRFIQVMDKYEGMAWVPTYYPHGTYAVLIDSMLVEPSQYQTLLLDKPTNIAKIYISHESAAISAKLLGGYLALFPKGPPPPVIAIFTKNHAFRRTDDPSIVYYAPKGYDFTKEFYTPKYDNPQNGPVTADLRSTVYWNPRILTRAYGQTKVSYFNGDQTGTYRVTVEGIDANGLLARKVYRYTVQ